MMALDSVDTYGGLAILACSLHYFGSLEARGNMDCHIPPSSAGLEAQVGRFRVGDMWPECQCGQRLRCLLLLARN